MDGFQQALDYISNIDNSSNIQEQNNIINSICLADCDNKKELLMNQLTNLNNLEIIIRDAKEKLNIFINKIDTHKIKLSNTQCKSIDQLCQKITNTNQVTILNRIVTDKEYSKIYLSGYEPNTETTSKKKDLIGTVKVLGTFNEKKQCREEYEIRLFRSDPKGMFWCSCADHKFNSTKKNIVCKHICFLICKIAKVLKPEVFENKKFTDIELAGLLTKLTSSGDIWQDCTIAKILGKITLDTFKLFVKAIEDCCPVCFNDLIEEDKPNLLACPSCKNYIHNECADIWMEQKKTCVLCKSDLWKYYDKVKTGGSVSVIN